MQLKSVSDEVATWREWQTVLFHPAFRDKRKTPWFFIHILCPFSTAFVDLCTQIRLTPNISSRDGSRRILYPKTCQKLLLSNERMWWIRTSFTLHYFATSCCGGISQLLGRLSLQSSIRCDLHPAKSSCWAHWVLRKLPEGPNDQTPLKVPTNVVKSPQR